MIKGAQSHTPLPWVAGVLAAVVACPLVYAGWVRLIGPDQLVPTILMGVMVGAAFRFTAKPVLGPHLKAAIGLSVLGSVLGFIVGDYMIWTPFAFGQTVRRLLSFSGLLAVGLSTYLGYLVAWSGRLRSEPA